MNRALKVEKHDGIAEVSLLGPGKGNALGMDFFREAPEVFGELDRDRDVRVVVLRGAGKHFSYGTDLIGMAAEFGPLAAGPVGAPEREHVLDLIRGLQDGMERVERCRKPVIAAIHGWCIGGGLDLAAACDFRICSADARFSLREVRMAIVADLGSLQRLPRIVGQGHAREIALSGKDFDAERALRIGFVNDVFPSSEALFEAAHEAARTIAANPPLIVQGVKQVMAWGDGLTVEQGLRLVAAWNAAFLPSKDLGEAVSAFVEKRPPKFRGE